MELCVPAHWGLSYLVPTAPRLPEWCFGGTSQDGSLCYSQIRGMCSSHRAGRDGRGKPNTWNTVCAPEQVILPSPPHRLPLLIYFRNRLAIPFCDTHHHCQVQSRHKSVQIRCSHYGREISSLDARVRSGSLAFPSIPFTKLILSSSETCVSQTVERQAQSAGPLGVRS